MTSRPPPLPTDERLARTQELIAEQGSDVARWREQTSLATQWNARARLAASLIEPGARVLDVGCGDMALRGFLPTGCRYVPADIVARAEDCLVVDLNKGQFPQGEYDVVCFLGVLEYVHDPAAALARAARAARGLVVSYCADTSGDQAHRRGMGWVNDHTVESFEALLRGAGWRPVKRGLHKRSATNAQYLWKCARPPAETAG